jgi:hypothetical protein
MRICYTTALLLAAWFLMQPPPAFPPVQDASGNYKLNSAAPLTQWVHFKTFESEQACVTQLQRMPSFYKCVASYDPALKQPAGAPTTSTITGAIGHTQ